ncbi:MAG: hydroxymethylbilane synthase [Neisseriaceae bacterium]|jgi:hydroxymethylbilane synthase
MEKLRIISRNSPLAIAQSKLVSEQINALYPDLFIEIIGITTEGDKILDKHLDKIGGKGLFVKELQQKLLDGEADIAVHSLKDLPHETFSEFIIPAVLKREDVSDCFISNHYDKLADLPKGAIIGTSSARRIALVNHYYPHLKIKMLRGNVGTRLAKLDNGDYDGIILASAGLKRLNLTSRIKETLDPNTFVPAIGQGALAIEILSNRLDLMILLAKLDDNDTWLEVETEREVGKLLGADCSMPIGVHANVAENGKFNLTAMVFNDKFFTVSVSDCKDNYLSLAKTIIKELKNKGLNGTVEKTLMSKQIIYDGS